MRRLAHCPVDTLSPNFGSGRQNQRPIETDMCEGQLAVVVGDRGHVALSAVAEDNQVVECGDLGQMAPDKQ